MPNQRHCLASGLGATKGYVQHRGRHASQPSRCSRASARASCYIFPNGRLNFKPHTRRDTHNKEDKNQPRHGRQRGQQKKKSHHGSRPFPCFLESLGKAFGRAKPLLVAQPKFRCRYMPSVGGNAELLE